MQEKLGEDLHFKKTSKLPSRYPTIIMVKIVQVASTSTGKPRHTMPPPTLSPEHARTLAAQQKKGEEEKKTATTRTRTPYLQK